MYVSEDQRCISLAEPNEDVATARYAFTFDRVYHPACDQEEVYEDTAKKAINAVLHGFNATVMAYGQTGTGKTYTMEGLTSGPKRGIIPRTIEDVFKFIRECKDRSSRFLVRGSYLQIYKDEISDLLRPERTNLEIREDPKRGVFVKDVSEWLVSTPEGIFELIDRGSAQRATGSTRMNDVSSRSHAVFILIVEQSSMVGTAGSSTSGRLCFPCSPVAAQLLLASLHVFTFMHHGILSRVGGKVLKSGKLNLVDLAGSERYVYFFLFFFFFVRVCHANASGVDLEGGTGPRNLGTVPYGLIRDFFVRCV